MNRGIKGFQPTRLLQVLAARRLTQVQLAAMVGVSPSTISKWKNEEQPQAPEPATLVRLAEVVNVRPEWFLRSTINDFTPPLYRSNASAHVAAREMMYARLQWAQDIAVALQEYVDFPEVNIPECHFGHPDDISNEDIEAAAEQCRKVWNLGTGPIADILMAMESAGVIVIREETGVAAIEGVSTWSSDAKRPFVLLAADKGNGFRSRFDAAHELGHLVLHRQICRITDPVRHKAMEKQAHRFAGAFLLPAESFGRDVASPVTLDSLLLLKQRWGVSAAAMIMRLEALGIITTDEATALFKRRSARWGAKSEPNDEMRLPEKPRLLKRTIELLLSSGMLTTEGVQQHLGLAAVDIESLSGLQSGVLSRDANVVELATLKRTPSGSDSDIRKGTDQSKNVIQFPGRR